MECQATLTHKIIFTYVTIYLHNMYCIFLNVFKFTLAPPLKNCSGYASPPNRATSPLHIY